jgi:hypothetical protein
MMAVLAHESCPVNGETYMGGMRRYSRLFLAETEGYVHPDLDVTPEAIAEHWDTINDPSNFGSVPSTSAWTERNAGLIRATPIRAD